MKINYLCLITLIIIVFTSCKNSDRINSADIEKVLVTEKLPFEGNWTRNFELAKDSVLHVYYSVWTDSIQYEIQGPLSVKYMMYKDTFISKDNRWIGRLNKVPFVIFLKNISPDSITLYKKEVKNNSEALQMHFPSKKDRSHFSSWNTYYLKK